MHLSPPPAPPEVDVVDPAPPPREPRGSGAQVWLVRHGAVEAQGIAYGDLDVRLSPAGAAQTERTAEALAALRPHHVTSSPLARARALGEDTARRSGLELAVDDRWREVSRGAWQGLPLEEYARRWRGEAARYWSDPMGWRGHGGESEAELRTRVVQALEAHLERAVNAAGPSPPLLVVTAHRQSLRALVGALLGLPAGASHGLELDLACGALVVDDPTGWQLARSNVRSPGAPHAAEPAAGPPGDVF